MPLTHPTDERRKTHNIGKKCKRKSTAWEISVAKGALKLSLSQLLEAFASTDSSDIFLKKGRKFRAEGGSGVEGFIVKRGLQREVVCGRRSESEKAR